MITLYEHPEDAGFSFNPKNNTITAWNEDDSVTMPIGRLGLAEAGQALLALADKVATEEVGASK